MKIRLQTKRGLNTLKFGGYSEILTLFLRGNWKSGYNVSILLLPPFRIFPRAVFAFLLRLPYGPFTHPLSRYPCIYEKIFKKFLQ